MVTAGQNITSSEHTQYVVVWGKGTIVGVVMSLRDQTCLLSLPIRMCDRDPNQHTTSMDGRIRLIAMRSVQLTTLLLTA